jgi:DNA repair and recombination RAD54-like protein
MNCIRCQNYNERPESVDEGDGNQSANISGQSDQETSDIGGFAQIAGCLNKLKSSEKQVGHIHSVDITASNFILGV